MPRITTIDPSTATGQAKDLLAAVKAKLGLTPNMMKTMAAAPSVLEGYLAFSGALGHGSLSPKVREAISLATAQANECDYCLAAHTALGKMAGLKIDDVNAARRFEAADKQTAAALAFSRAVLDKGGAISEAEFNAVKAAGFNEGQIAEIIGNVALNWFTNAFNKAAGTEVDFPRVALNAPAA